MGTTEYFKISHEWPLSCKKSYWATKNWASLIFCTASIKIITVHMM